MEKQYQYNSVEEALEELRRGRIVLVTDDPDRENEGDMICAAEFATQENINFMACHAKGLICTPMSAALAGRLGLSQMVSENTDNHSTPASKLANGLIWTAFQRMFFISPWGTGSTSCAA